MGLSAAEADGRVHALVTGLEKTSSLHIEIIDEPVYLFFLITNWSINHLYKTERYSVNDTNSS